MSRMSQLQSRFLKGEFDWQTYVCKVGALINIRKEYADWMKAYRSGKVTRR